MSDSSAAFCWAFAALAFWAVWLVVAVIGIPQLWYLPLARELSFGAKPPGLAMGLFGQLLSASCAATAAGAIAWAATRRRAVPVAGLWGSILAGALVLVAVVAVYAVEMWGRVP